MNNKAIQVNVEGMVQGVGFRYSTLHQARRLRLKGYVQNLPNGMVKVLAEGDADNIERLKTWLKRGPTGTHVRKLEVRYIPYSGLYRDFDIEY